MHYGTTRQNGKRYAKSKRYENLNKARKQYLHNDTHNGTYDKRTNICIR